MNKRIRCQCQLVRIIVFALFLSAAIFGCQGLQTSDANFDGGLVSDAGVFGPKCMEMYDCLCAPLVGTELRDCTDTITNLIERDCESWIWYYSEKYDC